MKKLIFIIVLVLIGGHMYGSGGPHSPLRLLEKKAYKAIESCDKINSASIEQHLLNHGVRVSPNQKLIFVLCALKIFIREQEAGKYQASELEKKRFELGGTVVHFINGVNQYFGSTYSPAFRTIFCNYTDVIAQLKPAIQSYFAPIIYEEMPSYIRGLHPYTWPELFRENKGVKRLNCLVQNGTITDINAPYEYGRTLAMYATLWKAKSLLRELVGEFNADINACSSETGDTPLLIAARDGDVKMMNYLRQLGATYESSVASWAKFGTYDLPLQALPKWCLSKSSETQRKIPLYIAIDCNNDFTTRYLIDWFKKHWPNGINVASANGSTPLMLAAYKGRSDLVALLLGANADVAKQDSSGRDALECARQAERVRGKGDPAEYRQVVALLQGAVNNEQ